MPFTPARAQKHIRDIQSISSDNKESQIVLNQLRHSLASIKISTPEERKEIARVAKYFTKHVREKIKSEHQVLFAPILRLIDIHLHPPAREIFLKQALELQDEPAIRLLEIYGLNINAPQDEEDNTLLHLAVKAWDLNMVKCLIDTAGADINLKNQEGATALHLAAEAGQLDILELLLARGAAIDALDEHGNTPFDYAAIMNQVDILRALKKHGANISIASFDGNTPLHSSVMHGHELATRFLVEKCEMDINLQNLTGLAPLHFATQNADKKMLSFLLGLKHKPDVNAKTAHGKTPLHLAIWNNDLEACKLLVDAGASTNIPDINNGAPLHYAAERRKLDILMWLIDECEVNINTPGPNQRTALHYAAENSDKEMLRYLLEHDPKADVNAKDENDETPIFRAVWNGDLEACILLASAGASIHIQNANHRTLVELAAFRGKFDVLRWLVDERHLEVNNPGPTLHYAAGHGDKEMVSYLIQHKADIYVQNTHGENALFMAVAGNGDLETCKLLAHAGICLTARNTQHLTLLHVAAGRGKLDIVQWLIEECHVNVNSTGQRQWTALHVAAARGDETMVRYLIEHKANVNALNGDGTPLLLAAKNDHETVCQLLVANKASMERGDNSGNGPVEAAILGGKYKVIEWFISKFGVNFHTAWGQTPLHLAIIAGDDKLVADLLSKGADISAKNHSGHTPLHTAASHGSLKICQLLVHHKPRGANVHARTPEGWETPLWAAIISNKKEVAKWLIEACYADINTQNAGLEGPLFMANDAMMHYLLARGADTSLRDEDGETALHHMVRSGEIEKAKLLLKAGASLEIRDNPYEPEDDDVIEANGQTPLEIAEENSEMWRLLKNFSKDEKIIASIHQIANKIILAEALDGLLIRDVQSIVSGYYLSDQKVIQVAEQILLAISKKKLPIEQQKHILENILIRLKDLMEEEALQPLEADIAKLKVVLDGLSAIIAHLPSPQECQTYRDILQTMDGLISSEIAKLNVTIDGLTNSANAFIALVPSPQDCQAYWDTLETMDSLNSLESAQRPSMLPELTPSNAPEAKEREAKHQAPLLSTTGPVAMSIDPDSATLLQPISSTSSLSSSSSFSSSVNLNLKPNAKPEPAIDWYWKVQEKAQPKAQQSVQTEFFSAEARKRRGEQATGTKQVLPMSP